MRSVFKDFNILLFNIEPSPGRNRDKQAALEKLYADVLNKSQQPYGDGHYNVAVLATGYGPQIKNLVSLFGANQRPISDVFGTHTSAEGKRLITFIAPKFEFVRVDHKPEKVSILINPEERLDPFDYVYLILSNSNRNRAFDSLFPSWFDTSSMKWVIDIMMNGEMTAIIPAVTPFTGSGYHGKYEGDVVELNPRTNLIVKSATWWEGNHVDPDTMIYPCSNQDYRGYEVGDRYMLAMTYHQNRIVRAALEVQVNNLANRSASTNRRREDAMKRFFPMTYKAIGLKNNPNATKHALYQLLLNSHNMASQVTRNTKAGRIVSHESTVLLLAYKAEVLSALEAYKIYSVRTDPTHINGVIKKLSTLKMARVFNASPGDPRRLFNTLVRQQIDRALADDLGPELRVTPPEQIVTDLAVGVAVQTA